MLAQIIVENHDIRRELRDLFQSLFDCAGRPSQLELRVARKQAKQALAEQRVIIDEI